MAYLKGFFLICLLLPASIRSSKMKIQNLNSIIKFLEDNYSSGRQYAAAINVPKDQCEKTYDPTTFLKSESTEIVREDISGDKYPVYKGTELIAAGVQRTPNPAHSEFLLLDPVNKSPLTDLLNKRKNGCVVFYTLNSPCIKTCLTEPYDIIPGVTELMKHEGINVFVFKHIWKFDVDKPQDLKVKLKAIADKIPLYRCDNNNKCILCGMPNSNVEMNEDCFKDKKPPVVWVA